MKIKRLTLSITASFITANTLIADTTSNEIATLKAQIAQLQETTQILIDETSDLKTGFSYTTVDIEKSHSGLGAAASKVYYSKSPLSIGGYGEMFFANKSVQNSEGSTSTVDVYRFVPYIGYKFSDNIILNTELEFEHGGISNDDGTATGGKVIMEFMYLDFLLSQEANIRLGSFLVPMGLINERHEPTLFTTVQRPQTSKYLIPSTWSESGAMIYGKVLKNFDYKLAAITGLKTAADGSSWIRGGRGGTFTNTDPKVGAVARLDYTGINGLLLGASLYADNQLTMVDAHIDFKYGAFRSYGVYTQTSRRDTDTQTFPSLATKAKGGFLNLSYDLLSFGNSDYRLPLFVQYESVNPQSTTEGIAAQSFDPVNTTTVGINFFPHEQVVLKMDYAMADNDYTNSHQSSDTFSVSLGYIF